MLISVLLCSPQSDQIQIKSFIVKENNFFLCISISDLIPRKSIRSTQVEDKLIICALYVLLGLSLIGMCFN